MTQFDGGVIESAGDAKNGLFGAENIIHFKNRYSVCTGELSKKTYTLDDIPLDDEKTPSNYTKREEP